MAPEQDYSTRRSHHGMALRYKEEAWGNLPKERFIEAMNAEGIAISGGYGFPLYKEPAFTNKDNLPPGNYPDYGSLFLPKAEKASKEGLLVPQTLLLAEPADAMDIVHAAEKVYENRKDLLKK